MEERARRKPGMPKLVLDDELTERIAELDGDQRVASLLAQLPDDQAGEEDDLRWLASRGDMAAIHFRSDLMQVMEYRAGCIWIGFWLRAAAGGSAQPTSAATTILGDLARWPTVRGGRTSALADGWASVARAARDNDAERLRAEQRLNRREVGVR